MSQAQTLLEHFTTDFLRGLAIRDPRIIHSLHQAQSPVVDPAIPPKLEFKLAMLFEALCLSSHEYGVSIDVRDWDSAFRKFCSLLMNPWPDSAISAAGYRIELSHRGNSLANTSYRLIPSSNLSKSNPLSGSA